MMQFAKPPIVSSPAASLADLTAEQDECRLTLGERDTYESLRLREPQLVSLLDSHPPGNDADWDVLVLWHHTTVLGALSFLVGHNAQRPAPHDRYARIDIVVVPSTERGLGIGRLLLAGATALLLRLGQAPPYSISCLAAHPAVSHTLEALGFQPQPRSHLHYVHEELRVDPAQAAAMADRCVADGAGALRRVRYALRQRQPEPRR